MKIGHYSSRCVALTLLALLKTVALVLTEQSQQCQNLMTTCPGQAPLVALGTGLESRAATCNPLSVETMLGDVFVWHFTRDSTNNGTPVNINNTDKYNVSGARNKTLTVNSIISTDEGYYYCQIFRNEMLLPDLVVGACLYVYNPAVFQTCSGDGNMNIPQKGCSERESLTTQEGQQVMFNIALTHQGPEENCHNQTIQSIEFRRDDGSSNFTIMCFSGSCNPEQSPRLNVLRTSNTFHINITLSGLMQNDSGRYTALADIRRPSNNMRVCIYKNFSLNVLESTTTHADSTTQSTTMDVPISSSPNADSTLSMGALIAIVVVIVVLVLLLIFLGVFVTILLLWTCSKNRSGKNPKTEAYATIKEVFRRDKKKKKNGVPLTDGQEGVYRRSFTEEGKVNLAEIFNSESNNV